MLRLITISLAVVTLLCGAAAQAKAEQVYAVTDNARLLSFDTATPGAVTSTIITGSGGTDNPFQGIDYRPSNGLLYGVTAGQVWRINPLTAAATFVSTLSIPITTIAGVDFDPVEDRLRVVTQNGQNLRINVETGQVINDGTINPPGAGLSGAAYTNNFAGATATTLYGIGVTQDLLYTINPMTGTLTVVGGLGVNATAFVGFDVSGATGIAYAALRPGGSIIQNLYTINLATGQATLIGQLGMSGDVGIIGLTVVPSGSTVIPEPATLILLGTGLLGVGAVARKRRQASKSREHSGYRKSV